MKGTKGGFRSLIRGRMNAAGYAVYDGEDKEIAARLAGPDVDEVWASQHIERCKEEIRATWSTDETGRRDQYPLEGVVAPEVPRIDFNAKGMRLA